MARLGVDSPWQYEKQTANHSKGGEMTNNNQNGSKQAVVYLRVSSAQQADKDFDAEGFSIPAQREACEREADNLGAEVAEIYIDRGESARSADRPALQAMLKHLKVGGIDFVIVHKIDRLARNRVDDVEIVMAIRKAGAQLVSVTENIDETPSGLLMHGIMSSIAEFFSRNLAAEVKKGSTQKAKKGGTPFQAPIGYLNVREMVDGREVRTVVLDPKRAPLMRDAFQLYSTGQYSLSELAAILEQRGLRSRSTRTTVGKPLNASRLNGLLRNPYYVGIVKYAGKLYPGRHEPLVDESTFQQVQALLAAKRVSGERSWRHQHHLRGSLFCAECGRRLMFTHARGNGGLYAYFVCAGRQHAACTQPTHRAEAVEAAVERHYATVQLSPATREQLREAVKTQASGQAKLAEHEVAAAERELTQLDQQERKLLAAHYTDRISEHLFTEEQARISRERASATKRIEQMSFQHEEIMTALDVVLELTEDIQAAYCQAGPNERRLFNQGFFERLEIDSEEVAGEQLQEPFREVAAVAAPREAKTPASLPRDGGLHFQALVPLRGFEATRKKMMFEIV
jgi:DNA invertase Pin-like site-specific DNA recombinase